VIEFMPESSGGVVGIRVAGKLTDADYKVELIPRLQSPFRQYGRLRVLFILDETFQGWDLHAAWDDALLGFQHRTDFQKIATVGAPSWVEVSIKLMGFLIRSEIRMFPRDQESSAWEWLRA
jgi:hypothetical protein